MLDTGLLHTQIDWEVEPLVAEMGSAADLEQVRRSPLLRARAALDHVLSMANTVDEETMVSAQLMMVYVQLCFRQYYDALGTSEKVMEQLENVSNTNGSSSSEGVDEAMRQLTLKRQMATARLYASEASCALGQVVEAMKHLVGDGKEDALDRLAFDLSGVTLETASNNAKGKRKLARAQATVRSCACVVTAALGNSQASKQLANSANAMEDAYEPNRERSSARRALIYALLRDGHHSPALNLLLSLR